jgi:UPF0755 protein
MKFLKYFLATILVVLFLLSALVFNEFRSPATSKEQERFVINPGIVIEGETIEELVTKGFLKNKDIFNLILDFKGWHGKIEPGAYLISKNMNAYELAKTLVAGPYQKWVVVPPGKRKEQAALILKRALSWTDAKTIEFIRTAREGYLYPDTYLIDVSFDPELVAQKFYSNFNEKFDAQIQKDLLAKNIRNDTAVKFASLIERESGGEEDKSIIAAIIWNRLDKKMRLEIDATVQYGQASLDCQLSSSMPALENCNFWPKLTPGTLQSLNSSYNTYLNEGLPPGPIASPTLSSIRAVVYPAQTDALYYLHSPDKQIHIAKTYEEHLQNIKQYLK